MEFKKENELLHIVFLGVIGCGKTTISKLIKTKIEVENELKSFVVSEPISEWKNNNLLKNFYEDKRRYAYTFQQFAFISRLMCYPDVKKTDVKVLISDGHIISDKHCFAEMLNESGDMSNEEFGWYKETYLHWKSLVPVSVPTVIVYLKCDTKTCIDRIEERGRTEEKKIQEEYLIELEKKYEKLVSNKKYSEKVIQVDASKQKEEVVKEIYDLLNKRELF